MTTSRRGERIAPLTDVSRGHARLKAQRPARSALDMG